MNSDALATIFIVAGVVLAFFVLRGILRFIQFHASEEPAKGKFVVTYTCENCYTIHKGPVSICRNCKLAGTVKRWESFEYD